MQKLYVSLFLFFICFQLQAQDTTLLTPATDTVSIIDLLHSDRLRSQKIDSATELLMVAGHVRLKQDNTLFFCDSAVINRNGKIMEAFGNIHINDSDSVHTYAQYLIYHMDTKIATLKKKVKMTDGKGVLTTEELEYDTRYKIGTYKNGGKVVDGKTVLTSKEATYYADLKDAYFKKDVKLRDPQYNLDTDSLLYNTSAGLATFITKTYIKDSSGRTIETSEGYYDMRNKIARFGKRPVIKDNKGVYVTGDEINSYDATGQTVIRGNAVYKDSAQNISVIANEMYSNSKTNTFLATRNPLMIIKQNEDSIYITADTLYSARLADLKDSTYTELVKDTIKNITVLNTKDTADIRYFQGFHHVRIFSDSLQAVCDSMFYSAKDSVFRLFTNPIVWATGNQVSGDTIYLFTKNQKAERLYVIDNSIAINKSGDNMFNQIAGRTLNGYFKDGTIDYFRAKGSPAQSVYYVKDEDDGLVGVNSATADVIDMTFLDKELQKVIFRSEVSGTMYPIKQLPEEKKQLRNFNWQEAKRPKTKYELFENPINQ
ncbi:MAG: OstA-like protein [Flavihumibacter sp.]|nr:OstA-like protein [Flavihumibacter sp.]